jgi:hypothetical protein
MIEELGQSAELNANHRDIDPGLGTCFGFFVISDQASVAHQPAEGALNHPASWQYFETPGGVGTLDDFNGQLGRSPLTHWANASPV